MVEYFFDLKKPLIPIFVTLNGRKGIVRVQGVIDTGSTLVAIPPEVADNLGYDTSGAGEEAKVSTTEGIINVPMVTLDEVSVLGQTAKLVKAAVIPLPVESRINCLVGMTFLRNFNISLDYTTGTMLLE